MARHAFASAAAQPDGAKIVLPAPEGEHRVGYWRTTIETRQPDDLSAVPDDFRRLVDE